MTAKTAKTADQTVTADPPQRGSLADVRGESFVRISNAMGIMRRMFVDDAATLKPEAMARKWVEIDSTEVFVLLVAGKKRGKDGNPNFKVGGVFATDALAEAKARGMGIDGGDIVRSWDDHFGCTGGTIRLDTVFRTTIPMGRAVVVRERVYGLALNAARLLEGSGTKAEAAKALDALFSPSFPQSVPEVWVGLGFEMLTEFDFRGKPMQPKAPTVRLRVRVGDQDKSARSEKFAVILPSRPSL